MNKIGRSTEIIKLDNLAFKSHSLSGFNIVVTGALEHFSRKSIEQTITDLGGNFQKTINRETSFLLIGGEHVGSKYDKAKDLKIRIIDENDFLNIILEKPYQSDTL
jgi:DNA ligase (NAD+)